MTADAFLSTRFSKNRLRMITFLIQWDMQAIVGSYIGTICCIDDLIISQQTL